MTRRDPLLLVGTAALVLVGGCRGREAPYLERRAAFQTKLIRQEASVGGEPQMYATFTPPADRTREVTYRSGGHDLKALVYVPDAAASPKPPGLVYLHGGFAVSEFALANCKPFIEAGYVVMVPMLRAENDNPGFREYMMGEVDDARAATQWLARQAFVDAQHLYVFGWSYGGGVAALLSLMDDVPVRHTASVGGLYAPIFPSDPSMPYDPTDRREVELRRLVGNIRWMRRPHYAYVGTSDPGFMRGIMTAKQEIGDRTSLLMIVMVSGDHFSSLPGGQQRYLELTQAEARALKEPDATPR